MKHLAPIGCVVVGRVTAQIFCMALHGQLGHQQSNPIISH